MTPVRPRPFFEVPGSAGDRRLLLISYHFPPGETAGALRWQKLSRHAAERGWQLDVVTLDPSSLGSPDMRRLEDLPPGTRVYGARQARAPEEFSKLVTGVARWVGTRGGRRGAGGGPGSNGAPLSPKAGFLPTADLRWLIRTPAELRRMATAWNYLTVTKRWALDAGRVAARIVDADRHRVIVTCGPPHMEHEAGRRLAQRTGLPLVMDLRDPWSLASKLPEPFASRLWTHLTERYERRAVAAASLVVANTEHMRRAMAARYPELGDRLVTVMNGYDEEHGGTRAPGGKFVAAYTGNIYIDRDPRPLFRAAAEVVRELKLDPATFGIELMGRVASYGGVATERLAREAGIEGYVTLHPPGPHAAVHELLGRAAMLVSLPQDSDGAIPSKIFEYMQYEGWLLVFAHPGSAPDLLLRGTAADVVDPGEHEQLVRVLRTRILEHRSGEVPARATGDGRFSRREQARLLFDAIETHPGAAR